MEVDDGERYTIDLDSKIASVLASLSKPTRDKFLAFLQTEKRGMHVSPYDIGLSASVRQRSLTTGHVHVEPAAFHPQGGQMTPRYNAYYPSGVMDQNSNYWAELSMNGYTSNCNISQCFQNIHQGRATLTIGSYGGTNYSAWSPPAYNLSAYEYFSIPVKTLWSNGGPMHLSGTDEARVVCQVFGSGFWVDYPVDSGSLFGFEFAVTEVQDQGTAAHPKGDGTYYFDVSYFCSAESSPPDWQPHQVHSSVRDSFVLGITACSRVPDSSGVPWICAAVIAETIYKNGLKWTSLAVPWFNVTYDCTNNDAGYGGFSGFTLWPW